MIKENVSNSWLTRESLLQTVIFLDDFVFRILKFHGYWMTYLWYLGFQLCF